MLGVLKRLRAGHVRPSANNEVVFLRKDEQQVALQKDCVFRVPNFMDFAVRQVDLERCKRLPPHHGQNGFGVHIPKSTTVVEG